jgi:hypothetical protein
MVYFFTGTPKVVADQDMPMTVNGPPTIGRGLVPSVLTSAKRGIVPGQHLIHALVMEEVNKDIPLRQGTGLCQSK